MSEDKLDPAAMDAIIASIREGMANPVAAPDDQPAPAEPPRPAPLPEP